MAKNAALGKNLSKVQGDVDGNHRDRLADCEQASREELY